MLAIVFGTLFVTFVTIFILPSVFAVLYTEPYIPVDSL
jgi:multidrug efflux pump subunit AcrB